VTSGSLPANRKPVETSVNLTSRIIATFAGSVMRCHVVPPSSLPNSEAGPPTRPPTWTISLCSRWPALTASTVRMSIAHTPRAPSGSGNATGFHVVPPSSVR